MWQEKALLYISICPLFFAQRHSHPENRHKVGYGVLSASVTGCVHTVTCMCTKLPSTDPSHDAQVFVGTYESYKDNRIKF